MGINIKNEEVVAAVRALAKAEGTSLSDAVRSAVKGRLQQINHRKGLAQRLRKLAQETGPQFKEPWKSVDHGDLLYDELGMPK